MRVSMLLVALVLVFSSLAHGKEKERNWQDGKITNILRLETPVSTGLRLTYQYTIETNDRIYLVETWGDYHPEGLDLGVTVQFDTEEDMMYWRIVEKGKVRVFELLIVKRELKSKETQCH